jgi:hypothetical protein
MTGLPDERHPDREQAISALKAAFVQGRLTSDEFDARVGQALASRTRAELAAITADIPVVPVGPAGVQPARRPDQPALSVKSGMGATMAAAVLAAALWRPPGRPAAPRRRRPRSRFPASSSSPCS